MTVIPKNFDIIFLNWVSTVFAKKIIDNFLKNSEFCRDHGSTYFYKNEMYIGFVSKFLIDDKEQMCIELKYPKTEVSFEETIEINKSSIMSFAKGIKNEELVFNFTQRENDYRLSFIGNTLNIAVYFRPGYPEQGDEFI
jgi:hypothetical protein